MSQATEDPSLRPAKGAMQVIEAEQRLTEIQILRGDGAVEQTAAHKIARDTIQTLARWLITEPHKTFEVQATADVRPGSAAEGNDRGKTLSLRLDIWKARQRQYIPIRVVAIDAKSISIADAAATMALIEDVPFNCANCGQEHKMPGRYWGADLPLKTATECTRCTLPIWLRLLPKE